MVEVTIVDYGLGNIRAFMHVFSQLNVEAEVATTADAVAHAKRLILPGVGSFDWAMARLNKSGMRDALDEHVLTRRCPVLGVCVGMQIMAERSDEGSEPGLGWIEGEVRNMASAHNQTVPLPHMGWNDIVATHENSLFRGIDAPRYYFLHSYFMQPRNEAETLATAVYGHRFTASIQRNNVYGTQFHPEKSHHWGIDLLRNFAGI